MLDCRALAVSVHAALKAVAHVSGAWSGHAAVGCRFILLASARDPIRLGFTFCLGLLQDLCCLLREPARLIR